MWFSSPIAPGIVPVVPTATPGLKDTYQLGDIAVSSPCWAYRCLPNLCVLLINHYANICYCLRMAETMFSIPVRPHDFRTSAPHFFTWACSSATMRLIFEKNIFGQYSYRFCPKITKICTQYLLILASKVCRIGPF